MMPTYCFPQDAWFPWSGEGKGKWSKWQLCLWCQEKQDFHICLFIESKVEIRLIRYVYGWLGFIILLSNSLETVSHPVAGNVSMMHHFLLCKLCLRNNRFPHVAELLTAVWSSVLCPPPGLSSFRVDGHSARDLVRILHLNVTLLSPSHVLVPSA